MQPRRVNFLRGAPSVPGVDLTTYQRLYTRSVRRFYEGVFDRSIAAGEWQHIGEVFHQAYRNALHRVTLAADADPALATPAAAGVGQSLLSMRRHEGAAPRGSPRAARRPS